MIVSVLVLSIILSDAKSSSDPECNPHNGIEILKNTILSLMQDKTANQEDYKLKNGTVIKRYKLTPKHREKLEAVDSDIDIIIERLLEMKEMIETTLESGYYYD